MVTYFVATKNAETEKYLKVLLVRSKGDKQTLTLLKMAYYYLQSKQIGNSRACVLKYLEKKPTNSGFSWRMLGNNHFIQASANLSSTTWKLRLNA